MLRRTRKFWSVSRSCTALKEEEKEEEEEEKEKKEMKDSTNKMANKKC